jgi:hypothetical protein
MRRTFLLGSLLLALLSAPALAQSTAQTVATCGSLSNPLGNQASLTQTQGGALCISGSISASTSATAASALPTLTAGSQPLYESLGGSLYVQPVYGSVSGGGTPVDGTHGLPVAIVSGGGSGGTSSSFGAAFPTTGTAAGMSQGGNMVPLTGTSNNLNVNLAGNSFGTLTVSASQSGTWTVQQGGSPWGQNLTQWGSVALGAPSTYGTSPGAVTVPGVNAFITNTPTVTANAGSGTFTVSGTVTANQGGTWTVQPGNTPNTSPWLTTDSSDGPVAAGTAAGKSGLTGCVFNSSAPSLTNGQQVANQCDSSGRQIVNVGTGTVAATQSGTWTVQPGNTANTTPWLVKPTDGTNAVTVKASGANAATTDSALVVAPSPNPSTVCTSVIAVNQTASTDLKTSTNKLHICSIMLVSAAAQSISLVEGTGSTCGTGTTALIGGTSASLSLAANGGFSAISDRAWLETQVTGDHLCLLQGGSGNVSGTITYTDHS